MFLMGWVNRIWIIVSSVYGTLCIVLLKTLKMGLYFSAIDTRGWPYRRRDHTLPSNHTFTGTFVVNRTNTVIIVKNIYFMRGEATNEM